MSRSERENYFKSLPVIWSLLKLTVEVWNERRAIIQQAVIWVQLSFRGKWSSESVPVLIDFRITIKLEIFHFLSLFMILYIDHIPNIGPRLLFSKSLLHLGPRFHVSFIMVQNSSRLELKQTKQKMSLMIIWLVLCVIPRLVFSQTVSY